MTSADDVRTLLAGVFDRSAPTYDTNSGDFFGPAGRDLVALAGVGPGERVLDLGCGRGAVLFAAAEAVGDRGRVIGIDLAARMVELTAAQAGGLAHVEVRQGDAGNPEVDGDFDAVLASFVLFFLPDLTSALANYRELLRDGGRLAFTTFGEADPPFEAAMEAIGSHIPDRGPARVDRQGPLGSVDGIASVLTQAGFRDVRTEERFYETGFDNFDEWTAWVWSHGGRATLERVPAESLPAAYADARAALAPAYSGEHIAMRTGVRLTVAAR